MYELDVPNIDESIDYANIEPSSDFFASPRGKCDEHVIDM